MSEELIRKIVFEPAYDKTSVDPLRTSEYTPLRLDSISSEKLELCSLYFIPGGINL